MNVLGVIPARAGSARIISKNVQLVSGLPLFAWTAEFARVSRLTAFIVSSDCPVVEHWCQRLGFPYLLRPAELSTETASSFDAVKHAARAMGGLEEWDAFVQLNPTNPMRDTTYIDAAVSLLETRNVVIGTHVDPKVHFAGRYLNDVEWYAFNVDRPRTQDIHNLGIDNGSVYAWRRVPIPGHSTSYPHALRMPKTHGWDIDEPDELEVARYMVEQRVMFTRNSPHRIAFHAMTSRLLPE